MALVVFVFKDILGFEAYSTEIIRLLEIMQKLSSDRRYKPD